MEVCAFLMEQGPNLEIANRRGMVPLLSATKHGHTQVLAVPSLVLLCPHSMRNIIQSFFIYLFISTIIRTHDQVLMTISTCN